MKLKKYIFYTAVFVLCASMLCGCEKENAAVKEIVYDAEYPYEVSVESYISETTKETYSPSDIKVPYINLESPDADAANNEMKILFDSTIGYYNDNAKEKIWYNKVSYVYFVNNNTLSVLVTSESGGTDVPMYYYYFYNFDIETGEKIDGYALFDRAGYAKEEIDKQVKEYIINFEYSWFARYGQYFSDYSVDQAIENTMMIYERQLEQAVLPIYLNKEGRIEMVLYLDAHGSQRDYEEHFFTVESSYSETVLTNAPEDALAAVIREPDEASLKSVESVSINSESEGLEQLLIMPTSDHTKIKIETVEFVSNGGYFKPVSTIYENKDMWLGEAVLYNTTIPEVMSMERITVSYDNMYAEYVIAYDGLYDPVLRYVTSYVKIGKYISNNEEDVYPSGYEPSIELYENNEFLYNVTLDNKMGKLKGKYSIAGTQLFMDIESSDFKESASGEEYILFDIHGNTLQMVNTGIGNVPAGESFVLDR